MATARPGAIRSTNETPSRSPAEAPAGEATPAALADLPAERQARVLALLGQIDPARNETIIAFGVDAQRALTGVSEEILKGVRNKDSGPAGEALSQMTLTVRELDVDGLRSGRSPSWFERVVLRRLSPLALFLQRYETVSAQVERVQTRLEGHRLQLVGDITRLDALYEMTLDYYHRLQDYICSGPQL